jgi:hypothetical protein
MSDRQTVSPNQALFRQLNALMKDVVAIERHSTWAASVHAVSETDFDWFDPGSVPELQTPFVPVNPPEPAIQYEMISLDLPPGRWVVSVDARHVLEGYPLSPPTAFTAWTKITVDGVTAELFPLVGLTSVTDPFIQMEAYRTFVFPVVLDGDGGDVRVFIAATSNDAFSFMLFRAERFSITAFPG